MDRAMLAGFSIFADADESQLKAIAAKCRVVAFDRGEELFTQDTVAANVYGVLDGTVELVLVVSEKIVNTTIDYEEALTVTHEILEKPIVVETLGAGDVFGWSSMVVPPGRWTATARCRTPAKVFSLPAVELQALFQADPTLGYQFMSRLGGVISQRLQHRTQKLIHAWGEAFDGGVI